MYSDLYTHSRFNPIKILSGVAIVIIVTLGMFMYSQDATPTRASKIGLMDHKIVNVSQKQLGVFWQGEAADKGWLIYGKNPNNLDQTASDERDIDGGKELKIFHLAYLRNLEPSTTYYYKIISNNEVVQSGGTDVFNAKTIQESIPSTTFSPIYGKVLYPNNQPAEKTLAMIVIGNAYASIGVSGQTGEWLIPLQYILDANTNRPVSIGENDPISIQIFNDTQRSLIRSTISRSRPLPQPVILGNNYSFIADTNVLAVQDTNQKAMSNNPKTRIEIRYPKQNAVIPGTAPLIKGYGIPDEFVSVQINSRPGFSARVRIDSEGEWDVPVQIKISAGTYTLIAVTKDRAGKIITMNRRFTLIKSGEQILGETSEATPSGTITPTGSISGTVSPSPNVTDIVASPSPEPDLSSYPTATPPPPISGLNFVPYIFAGVGITILGLGILFLL